MGSESASAATVQAELERAASVLAAAGSPAPRDEALALLGALLGVSSTMLLARPDRHMSPSEVQTYTAWIARRSAGEALPHITGHLAFMGLDVTVSRATPLPRRGARRLVEVALEWARQRSAHEILVAEIGAGCGAISLALAAHEPRFTRIYAVEPSRAALQVAASNGARHLLNLVIQWREGDDLDAVPERADLIICGYAGSFAQTPARVVGQAAAKLWSGGALMCSAEAREERVVAGLLRRALPAAQIYADPPFEGAVVVVAQTPGPLRGAAELESRR
jgi:release factor glutamine methyltransferase